MEGKLKAHQSQKTEVGGLYISVTFTASVFWTDL